MELVFKLWWQKYYFKLFLPPSLSSHTSSVFCVLYIFLHSRWSHPVQFSSVAQSCLTLCEPMDCNTPGFSVHHHLPEFTQTHVHCVGDAISSSVVPFSSCPQSLPASSLFQWVNSSHEVAKVLDFQLSHHSLQRNPRANLLQNGLVGSPCSPRDSQESSPTPQFYLHCCPLNKFFSTLFLDSIHMC